MGYPSEVRQYSFISPPRAYGPTGPVGQEVAFTVSSSARVLALQTTTFGLVYDAGSCQNDTGLGAPPGMPQGLVGSYVTIFADGADLGIIVGQTLASVSGGAAPALAAVGTLSATGGYTGATGTCHRIPSGTSERYLTQIGQDNFLGVVASATGTCRVFQSSGYGIAG
jgi:hypothetical protein